MSSSGTSAAWRRAAPSERPARSSGRACRCAGARGTLVAAGSAPVAVARTSSVDAAWLERLPTVLFEIGKVVGSAGDPSHLLARIAELVCQLVGAGACSIMLLDGARERMFPKAAFGLRAERLDALSFAVGEGVAGWVVQHGEAALIADAHDDPRFRHPAGGHGARATTATCRRRPASPSRSQIRGMLCVPLTARGEVIGVDDRDGRRARRLHADAPGAAAVRLDDDRPRSAERAPDASRGDRPPHRRVQPPVHERAAADRARPSPRQAGAPLAICAARPRPLQGGQRSPTATPPATPSWPRSRAGCATRCAEVIKRRALRRRGVRAHLAARRRRARRIEIAERVRQRVRAAPVQLAARGRRCP
jgi:hypothetical protein